MIKSNNDVLGIDIGSSLIKMSSGDFGEKHGTGKNGICRKPCT